MARTALAASNPGVDMVVERGWYFSTDFWSPKLFERFLFPHIKELAACAHRYGKKFGYVMTTGVEILGPRLADAGVDVLGPTNHFILHPVDALFPDTPWEGVEAMIDAWKQFR